MFGVVFGAVFLGAVVEEGKLGVAAQPCAEGVRAWHVFEFADVLEHFAFCDAFAGVFDDLEFDFVGEVVGDVALLPGWVEGGVRGREWMRGNRWTNGLLDWWGRRGRLRLQRCCWMRRRR